MAVYTKRLCAIQVTATDWIGLYEAPAGFAVVIRHMLFVNLAATSSDAWLIVDPTWRTGQWTLWRNAAVPANSTLAVDLRQALEPGDGIAVKSSGGQCSVAITGYVFPL